MSKKTYEVGDLVMKRKHLKRLPNYSVVISSGNRPMIVANGRTVAACNGGTGAWVREGLMGEGSANPYRVIHLGNVDE